MKVSQYLQLYRERPYRDFSEYKSIFAASTCKSNNKSFVFPQRNKSPNNYMTIAKKRKLSIEKRIKSMQDEDDINFQEEQFTQYVEQQVKIIERQLKQPIAIVNLNIVGKQKEFTQIYLYEDSNLKLIVEELRKKYCLSKQESDKILNELQMGIE